jgi:hypothetical protein
MSCLYVLLETYKKLENLVLPTINHWVFLSSVILTY